MKKPIPDKRIPEGKRERTFLTRLGISVLAFLNPSAARYIRRLY